MPITDEAVRDLNVGDIVYLTGEIFTTAGIPTHERLLKCLEEGEPLPFDMEGGALFHLGSLTVAAEGGSRLLG